MSLMRLFFIITIIVALWCSILLSQPRWAVQESGVTAKLNSVAFFDSTNGVIVGEAGTVLRSDDGGVTWLAVSGVTTYELNDVHTLNATTALTADGGRCIDAGCGLVIKTSDQGKSWALNSEQTADDSRLDFFDSENGMVVSTSWDFEGIPHFMVQRTTDGGTSWQKQYHWSIAKNVTDISYKSPSFAIAVSENSILKIDANLNCNSIYDVVDGGFRSVYFLDTLTGFVVGNGGLILQTTNGGATWETRNSTVTEPLYAVRFSSALNGYAVGEHGTILHTTNGGTTWSKETPVTGHALYSIYLTDDEHGWAVGANGTVVKLGTFATCSLSDTQLDFGSVSEQFSEVSNISIRNTGTIDLNVSAVSSDENNFSVSPSTMIIPTGENREFTISFTPQNAGNKSATITFTHNGIGATSVLAVQGVGLEYGVTEVSLSAKWNLVSNPRIVPDNNAKTIFPASSSSLFEYNQETGYASAVEALPGKGYWLKYDAPQIVTIPGNGRRSDTVYVKAGWNLIGGLSVPVATLSIEEYPPMNVRSDYYGYSAGYYPTTTLSPGKAYWVRVAQNGYLILSSE